MVFLHDRRTNYSIFLQLRLDMKYLISLIFLVLAANTHAQITFTQSDYINLRTVQANGTLVDSALNASILRPIVGDSGLNQTWDFTKASYNSSRHEGSGFIPYSDTILGANDSAFLAATYVEESSADTVDNLDIPPSYEFYKINSSGAWDLGGCDDSDGIQGGLLNLNPAIEIFPFPLTYQTTWQSTSSENGPAISVYNSTLTQIEVADGYGTLILPNYSGNALRVKETFIIKDSVQGFVGRDTAFFYNFYTLDGYSAFIGTYSNGNVESASYTSPANSAVDPSLFTAPGLSMTLTQNPVRFGSTALIITLPSARVVQIELMDILGRSVQMVKNGFEAGETHSVPIDTKALRAGTYFVRVQTTNGESAMQQLVVQ